jgi:hypothetical protein
MKKSIPFLLCISILASTILIPVAQAGSVTTVEVITNSSTKCVTFHGSCSGTSNVWFEFGSNISSEEQSALNPNHTKSFATRNQSVSSGDFYDSRCGLPLIPDRSYVVQAVGIDGSGFVYGDNVNFTFQHSWVGTTPHVTLTYEQQVDVMLNEGGFDTPFINGQRILTNDIWQVYIEVLGSLFFGLLVAFIFMNITIKQRTVVMAFLLTILTGTTLWAFMPDEFVFMAQSMCIIAISGLLFWLFMKRK